MKLSALNYSTWGSPTMTLSGPDVTLCVTLTEEDQRELEALALRLFEKRQAKIVSDVAALQPQLTHILEGEFKDVE